MLRWVGGRGSSRAADRGGRWHRRRPPGSVRPDWWAPWWGNETSLPRQAADPPARIAGEGGLLTGTENGERHTRPPTDARHTCWRTADLGGCAKHRADLEELVHFTAAREEGPEGVHLCHDAANGPQVHRRVVARRAQQHLGSAVPERGGHVSARAWPRGGQRTIWWTRSLCRGAGCESPWPSQSQQS